jgi:hypothetical protein
LLGGLLALAAQLVYVLLGLALGPTSPLLIPLTLMAMCFLVVATYPCGLYGRWINFGLMGGLLPISGLTAGVCAAYCDAKKATGQTRDGVVAGVMLVVRFSGSGLVTALAVALLLAFVSAGG